MSKRYRLKRMSAFDILNYMFFSCITILMAFPIWNVFVISITDYREYVLNPLMLFPDKINFNAYRYIFSTGEILSAIGITVCITVVGTAISMVATTAAAYALSKKTLPGRNLIFSLVLVTMFFSGGMIPSFLLVKSLGLYNSVWVMILPGAINTFYMIIMKNNFTTIPAEMEEASKIDGANDLVILFKVVLPISMPIIATMLLFYGVEKWNEWWSAMMYLSDSTKYPLQLVLRNLIVNSQSSANMSSAYAQITNEFVAQESMKMATAMVAIVPIALVYPSLQKYFAKGMMIGAIKS